MFDIEFFRGIEMLRFLKDSFYSLITIFFTSFYASYFVTVNYQIFSIHKSLIVDRSVNEISFGIITFVIFAFLPIMLWRMTADSEIPLFKRTERVRLLLSYIEIVYTGCLFISKIIFNAIAKDVMSWQADIILDAKGRALFVEIFSIGIPFILFLWLTKKVVTHFKKENNELEV